MKYKLVKLEPPKNLINVNITGYFGDADFYDSLCLNFDLNDRKFDTEFQTYFDELIEALFDCCDALCKNNPDDYGSETVPYWERFNLYELLPRMYEFFEQTMNVDNFKISYYDENGEAFLIEPL